MSGTNNVIFTEKVAVLLCTYNGEDYLEDQLISVLEQDYPNIKVYVYDDGSNDGTREIVSKFVLNYPGKIFGVEIKECHLGYPDCYWKLLEVCPRADYYAFCDQDDVWDEKKISSAIAKMNASNESVPVLYLHDYENCNSKLLPINVHRASVCMPLSSRKILFYTIASGFSMIINDNMRQLLNEEKLAGKELYHDEWCIWSAYYNGTVIYDNLVLAKYRRHKGTYTSYGNGMWIVLKSWIQDEVCGNEFEKKCQRIRRFVESNPKMVDTEKEEWILLSRRRGEKGYFRRLFFPHRLRPSIGGEVALRVLFLLNW